LFLLGFLAFPLWAGDVASFVDLGFSSDGKIYMFAQYGVHAKTLYPWADLFVVDVPRNDFVSGGRVSFTHGIAVVPGQDGSSALSRILSRNAALADRYGMNFLNHGRLLFVALDNNDGKDIEFRDFEQGSSYRAALVSQVEGTGADLKSSFYINLELTDKDGNTKRYLVGNPQIKRRLISDYRICKVIIAPEGGSIILVIEEKLPAESGFDIRYMIEALDLSIDQ
jgi:predicted secreted protein